MAADLLAETFAVAYEQRHSFRDIGRPGGAWLYGIAARELSHWFRRRQVELRAVRRLGIAVPQLDDQSIERIEALADADGHRAALATALGQLSSAERLAVEMRVVEELDYAQIGRQLDCTEGAARTRMHRGLARLQRSDGGPSTMSEIPFVNLLGDAIDEAIVAPRPAARPTRRRTGRRYIQVALAALLVAGGTAAVAEVLSDPDELATAGVACYEGAYPSGGAAVDWAGTRSPVEVCARALGIDGRDLVACDTGGSVAVLRRSGPRTCASAGLGRLPIGLQRRPREGCRLERGLLALQTSADCIPPEELARRAQALLGRLGWSGWRTNLRRDVQDGPCGAILQMGGTPRLTLAGALDYPGRELMVTEGLPRSLSTLSGEKNQEPDQAPGSPRGWSVSRGGAATPSPACAATWRASWSAPAAGSASALPRCPRT